jgi:hypothetical protein
MNKLLFTISGLLFIGLCSSCTKEYTCACTFTDTSKNFEVKLENMRKNDAKTVCYDYNLFVGNCDIK